METCQHKTLWSGVDSPGLPPWIDSSWMFARCKKCNKGFLVPPGPEVRVAEYDPDTLTARPWQKPIPPRCTASYKFVAMAEGSRRACVKKEGHKGKHKTRRFGTIVKW